MVRDLRITVAASLENRASPRLRSLVPCLGIWRDTAILHVCPCHSLLAPLPSIDKAGSHRHRVVQDKGRPQLRLGWRLPGWSPDCGSTILWNRWLRGRRQMSRPRRGQPDQVTPSRVTPWLSWKLLVQPLAPRGCRRVFLPGKVRSGKSLRSFSPIKLWKTRFGSIRIIRGSKLPGRLANHSVVGVLAPRRYRTACKRVVRPASFPDLSQITMIPLASG